MTTQYMCTVQLAHTCRLAAVCSLHAHTYTDRERKCDGNCRRLRRVGVLVVYKRNSERSVQCMRCCVIYTRTHTSNYATPYRNIEGATSHCLWLRQNCSVSTSMLCSSFSLSSTRLGTQATRYRQNFARRKNKKNVIKNAPTHTVSSYTHSCKQTDFSFCCFFFLNIYFHRVYVVYEQRAFFSSSIQLVSCGLSLRIVVDYSIVNPPAYILWNTASVQTLHIRNSINSVEVSKSQSFMLTYCSDLYSAQYCHLILRNVLKVLNDNHNNNIMLQRLCFCLFIYKNK